MTPNSTALDPVVPVRLIRGQKDALDEAARLLGVSRSDLMRRGIALVLEETEEKRDHALK
jgi:predicted HTH domain antitoxin